MQTIKVTAKGKAATYRGARAAVHAFVLNYNGKSVQQFCTAYLANPPSTPKKGKLAKQPEPPMGWLRFFVSQGVISLG